MSEYKEHLKVVTDELGDEVAKINIEDKESKSLTLSPKGEDCILVRNDDGTAMVLVNENGKWRLAE